MVIVFIGPPGCGKGTQANILKDTILPDLNILTVSSLLKEKSQDQSVLGKEIKNKMDNGDLIEDTVVISVLKEKVNTFTNEQILIDGFPRSSIQADSLVEIFVNEVLSIINFEVDDDQLLQRIKKRSLEETRADDSFFEKRLQIYKKSHQEILNSLKKNYQVTDIQANDILKANSLDPTKRIKDFSEDEISKIRKSIDESYTVEGDLRRVVSQNIKRLKDLGCYRGLRHRKQLPTRGQRTHTNARTRKGKAVAIAGKKKVTKG